jgi:tetratricopeptide (TPR) repeat protein
MRLLKTFVLFLPSLLFGQEFQTKQALWDSTLLWITEKDYASAQHGLERLSNDFPTSTKVLYNLGVVYARENLNTKAYDAFSKLEKIEPTFPGLQKTLGLLAIKTGQKANVAVAHFQRAIQEDSLRFDAWMNLGSLSLSMNDYKSAIFYLKKARQFAQAEWTPSLELSRAYRRVRYVDSAARLWDKIPSSGVNQADISAELALVLIEFNQWDSAMTLLRRAFNNDMDDPVHRLNYSVTLLETNRFEEAEKVLLSLHEQPDLKLPVVLNTAALNLKRGKIDLTIDALNEVVKTHPELGVAWMNLGIAYDYKLLKKEACHCWQKAAAVGTPNAQLFLANECVEF